MIKFPSIEQFRTVIRAVKDRAQYTGKDDTGSATYDRTLPLPTITFTGTTKLHGTNAGIVLTRDGEYYAQSRERVLSITSDNAGFCVFALKHEDFIRRQLQYILDSHPTAEAAVVYGEWCGNGIQKGVAVSQLEKMLVVFDVAIVVDGNKVWLPENTALFQASHRNIHDVYTFQTVSIDIDFNSPDMIQNKLIELTNAVEQECPVGKHFGVSGIGEGIVYSAYIGDDCLRFKVKGEKHSSSKVKTLAAVDVEKLENIQKFVEYAVTESRLPQGIQVLKESGITEPSKANTGDFVRWVINDVAKEELDTIIENNFVMKDVNPLLSKKASNWYINFVA